MGFGCDIIERKRYQDVFECVSCDKMMFIFIISYELCILLNGIVGLSCILLDIEFIVEQEKYFKIIYVLVVMLGNIFNDIIDMDKMEWCKVQFDNQLVDFISFFVDLENFFVLQV